MGWLLLLWVYAGIMMVGVYHLYVYHLSIHMQNELYQEPHRARARCQES